jgi:hypothetical protein
MCETGRNCVDCRDVADFIKYNADDENGRNTLYVSFSINYIERGSSGYGSLVKRVLRSGVRILSPLLVVKRLICSVMSLSQNATSISSGSSVSGLLGMENWPGVIKSS